MDARQRRYVDSTAYRDDATYKFQVDFLGQVITRVESAMRDEGVDEETVGRVINLLLYGTPYGIDAHMRVQQNAEMAKLPERLPVSSVKLSEIFRDGSGEGRG